MEQPPRTGADIAAGVAVIAAPFAALLVKAIAPGWMLLIYVIWSLFGIPLIAFAIVVAVTGFLTRRAAFGFAGAGRMRARVAAWAHAVTLVLAPFVLIDGGDDGTWTSALALLFGQPPNSALAEAGNILFYPFAGAAAASFVWLVVEWVLALRARTGTRS